MLQKTRIINYTTRKQPHEFTIWKHHYFVCLNYSPTLSTNLQSGNLITQRVKIKFHKQLEGLLSRNVLKILSGKVVFDKTICHEEEGKWLPAKEKPLHGFAISVYLVLRYYPPAGARCIVHLRLPQLKRMTPKVFPKLQMMTVPLARTHYCVHAGTLKFILHTDSSQLIGLSFKAV